MLTGAIETQTLWEQPTTFLLDLNRTPQDGICALYC